jgi:hypothetical protein
VGRSRGRKDRCDSGKYLAVKNAVHREGLPGRTWSLRIRVMQMPKQFNARIGVILYVIDNAIVNLSLKLHVLATARRNYQS